MASLYLSHRRLLVEAHLTARLPLEVLHRVCNVHCLPIDACVFKSTIEQLSCRADERVTGEVFLVAGLFANHHHAHSGVLPPSPWLHFPEDRLRRIFLQITAFAALY